MSRSARPDHKIESIRIRTVSPCKEPLVGAIYASFGYRREVDPLDIVWLAEAGSEPIGIVRIATEHETLVLRGMRVAQVSQRSGIGTRMLRAIEEWLGPRECYCVPYAHLERFYGQVGFTRADPGGAPEFLIERVSQYRGEGLDVILLRRGSSL